MAFADITPQPGNYKDQKLIIESQSGVSSPDNTGVLKSIPGINGQINAGKSDINISDLSSQLISISKISDSFLSDATSVASQISSFVGDVFKDTTVKTASTTTTQIPDPVSKNLESASSSIFSILPFDVGSNTTSPTGSKNLFGSLSDQMTGTELSTLIDRYVTKDVQKLGQVISKKSYSDSLNSIFLDTSNIKNGITQNSSNNSILDSLGISTSSSNSTSVKSDFLNDYSSFVGETSSLAKSLGKTNLSEFYFDSTTSPYTVSNTSGSPIDTHGSGIDSVTANQVYKLATAVGCNIPGGGYNSYLNQASLYNAALNAASLYGLDSMVESMVNCVISTTQLGQRSLKNAFSSSSSSRLSSALLLLGGIINVVDVATSENKKNILTNPNLTRNDVADVNTLMTGLGSTVTDEVSVPGVGSTNYPLYDLDIISNMQPNFTDEVLQDESFVDLLQGSEVNILPTGILTYA